MEMKDIIPVNWESNNSIIKVIGVGGGGGNAVSQMYQQGIKDVDFMICNTDTMALKNSPVTEKVQLGHSLAKGLGAGCDPERGRAAAMESIDQIRESLTGHTEMVFITAGMGGGTGTGAAPVIARIAHDMGLLTVGVVTLPFRDEGQEFLKRAIVGIKELERYVDSLLIIDNQKIYKIFGELNIFDAFPKSNSVLSSAVKGIAEIITRPGFINVDFADVKMIMSNSGMALLGTGTASGENRAIRAVEEAFSSPLLNDYDLKTAKGVLVNITSSNNNGLTMAELSQIMDYIKEYTGDRVMKFKRGVVNDPEIGEAISVTVVATGFDMHSLPQISTEGDRLVETVTLGEDYQIPANKPQVVIDLKNHGVELPVNRPERAKTTFTPKQVSDTPREKPALIMGAEDNIVELETQPAYIRRRVMINKEERPAPQQPAENRGSGSLRIEERDGKQHLMSDNSYLHQTQD
ncbi:MAG: cell division protein FtsZ [Bacteroidetes bacterium HGW-Bacteroidetes-10]|nr:MAG: cell division protein FtsZ [Bacteroidetes bacterium HGW-Bacteroidetes-10]